MTSIQNRLTVYIIAGTAILLIAAGLAVEYLIRRQLAEDFDRNLLEKASLIMSLTDRDARLLEFDFSYEFMPEFDPEDNDRIEYFEMWLPDGTSFAKSPSLREAVLAGSGFPPADPRFEDVALPDGRTGRMVSLSFAPQVDEDDDEEGNGAVPTPAAPGEDEEEMQIRIPDALPADVEVGLVVARGREPLTQVLDAVRTILIGACIGLIGTVALVTRLCVNRGLLPLRQIAGEVRGLDSTKLNTRLSATPGSEELRPITDQLNHLLERLDDAFEREKRFSGNVAHELRTPIAELRTMAEVGQKWPGDQGMVRVFFGDLVNLADDMERTVTNLLNLARLDAGQREVELETVNLSSIIDKCWRQVASEAAARSVCIENRVERELRVRTDKDKLVLIVTNLLSNSVHYSPVGSEIQVDAVQTDSRIRFSVSNRTMDLTEKDLPLMFERFWRKEMARTKGRYAGLGLSLVAAMGEILDLQVKPELDAGGRLTMTLHGFQTG